MNAPSKIEASLSAALVSALAEIGGATKDKINPAFKSKYADLGSVIDAIKPVLAAHGLAFTQHPEPSEDGVMVETFVRHSGGDFLSLGKLYVPANKRDAQGFGSALTYARRYGLMTAFGVPAEDDDGNAAAKSARPTTGETPPAKRQPLAGPHTSPTALQAAIKSFVGTLERITDFDEFNAYMQTSEVIELEKQAVRDLPAWWETGDEMPAEFEPVVARIHRKKRALEELDNIHANTRTVIDAG